MGPALLIVNHGKILIADGGDERTNRRFEGLTMQTQIDGLRLCRSWYDDAKSGLGVKRIESELHRRPIEGDGNFAVFNIDPLLVKVLGVALGEGRRRR